nr:hypothetical protein [Evansella caseinilytica]
MESTESKRKEWGNNRDGRSDACIWPSAPLLVFGDLADFVFPSCKHALKEKMHEMFSRFV